MVVRDDPVIDKWRAFDWESLQAYLDGEIRAQESRQSAAEEGKGRLLTHSTKYRETTDKEQRKAALPLIKAFQREVDECRDRERAIGAALVHIFGQLADLPDPRSSLALVSDWSQAAARATTAEEEAAVLKQEIAQITEEFAGLKNQDVTVRQLREQIKQLEQEKMSAIERLLAETEKVIQDSSTKKEQEERELREQHTASVNAMEKQIVDLETRVRAQQRLLDGARTDAGHKETVEGEEKEEREREMETMGRKLKAAEREIAALTAELKQAKTRSSSPPASPIDDIAALGSLMKEKDEQIAKLLEDNRRFAAKAAADVRAADQKMAKMQSELSKQRELIIHMQAELAGKGDYDAVKQELRALREIELGPEAAAALEDNTPQTTVGEALKKLDKYMSEKNKKLQSENVQLRKTKEELNGSLAALTAQCASLSESDREKTAVIERLERDVERLTRGKMSAPVPDDPELTTDELLAASLGAVVDHSALQDSERDDDAAAGGGSHSMVDIVKAQRDRMKERLIEIEEALAKEKLDSARTRSEMEKVREDNTQLYGKVRFLQSHRSGSTAVTIDDDAADSNSAYKQEWEQTMSPFARFTNQESLRHVQRLPMHDKATLSIARAVFANPSARFTFFCYLIALHLLVFMVLYHFAWSSASSRDDCIEQFAKHMKEHHH